MALAAFAALVAGAYVYLQGSPRRLCWTMGELCAGRGGQPGHYDEFFACVDSVGELSATFGDDAIDHTAACVDQSQTCAEGMACMAGVTDFDTTGSGHGVREHNVGHGAWGTHAP